MVLALTAMATVGAWAAMPAPLPASRLPLPRTSDSCGDAYGRLMLTTAEKMQRAPTLPPCDLRILYLDVERDQREFWKMCPSWPGKPMIAHHGEVISKLEHDGSCLARPPKPQIIDIPPEDDWRRKTPGHLYEKERYRDCLLGKRKPDGTRTAPPPAEQAKCIAGGRKR